MTPISIRLTELRKRMRRESVDYYYVPAQDPHNNEYVPDHWQRRRWLTRFTGSAGDAMITLDHAFLWTDARYHLQAKIELEPKLYQLIQATQKSSPLVDWLLQQPDGFRFAVDPKVTSIGLVKRIRPILEAKQASLLFPENNLIDEIWHDRPPLPNTPIRLLETKYAGTKTCEKLSRLRAELVTQGINAIIINNLADIAWLFNIRGSDIKYNPMVIATAIVSADKIQLFVDSRKLDSQVKAYFEVHKIECLNPASLATQLQKLSGRVWLDPDYCNYWMEMQLKNACPHHQSSPIMTWKAIKNTTEILGMQEAHTQDALAVIKFLHWLENYWQNGVDEWTAASKLDAFRRENPLCIDLSFNTISGFGPNGAIIHYSATQDTASKIDDSSLYLVDSGGQYAMGTTDITRTVHLGNPTAKQKQYYTLVLKGHLALAQAVFPVGTRGEHIDAFARNFLWQQGLDYGHGTGHGVGCFSCVHESPPRISGGSSSTALLPDMVVSNEPGLYLEGQYGIRIENLCRIKEIFNKDQSETKHGPFYGFETLTLVPYCQKLIDTSLLSAAEKASINRYHDRIYTSLKPQISDEALLKWLQQATLKL